MKKLLITAALLPAVGGSAFAQDLTVSGFLAFEAAYGNAYDFERRFETNYNPFVNFNMNDAFPASDSRIRDLDFGVDGRLVLD